MVSEVEFFLLEWVVVCEQVGIPVEWIMLDLGFGFGKCVWYNLCLMKYLLRLIVMLYFVLVGVLCKLIIGDMLKVDVKECFVGSLALVFIVVWQGVKLIRIHDVCEIVQVVKLM